MAQSKTSAWKVVTAPVSLALFDPRVTAPLLVALLYYPQKLQSILPTRLHPLIFSPKLVAALKFALGLSVIRAINSRLSTAVVNNWTSDAKFVKSQEVVLISGGCSGIGKVLAEGFAKHGVKVIVLDIAKPKTPLRQYYLDPLLSSANGLSFKCLFLRIRRYLVCEDRCYSCGDPQGPRRSHCLDQQRWHRNCSDHLGRHRRIKSQDFRS